MSAFGIFALFLQQMAVGMLVLLPLVSRALIGRGFHRFIAITAAILLAMAVGLHAMGLTASDGDAGPWAVWTFALALATFLVVLFLQAHLGRDGQGRRLMLAAGAVGIASLVSAAWTYPAAWGRWWGAELLFPVNLLLSALALGAVVLAMILGHWYLIIKDLSIVLLRRLTSVMLWSLVARVVLTMITLLIFRRAQFGAAGEILDGLFALRDVILLLGFTCSLVFPLVLALMVRQTVKIHATQSATGLLYVAVIVMFIGEIVMRYLTNVTAVPL